MSRECQEVVKLVSRCHEGRRECQKGVKGDTLLTLDTLLIAAGPHGEGSSICNSHQFNGPVIDRRFHLE